MSILLDALKRSESQRDLGTVPTLQTNVESSAEPSRSLPGWLPALMSLTAAGLITWMGLAQFTLPDDWAETHPAAEAGISDTSHEESLAGNAVADQPAPSTGKSILPQLPETAAANQAPADTQAAQPRLERQVRDYAAEEPPAAAATQPVEPRRENAVREPQVARVDLGREEQGPATSVSPDRAESDQAPRPYEPEIINYWQVPEKMREGLPDLRISVLVYAELPENRFVLMNGERLREGQELPNGLVLEEIRRDRAIFNYRNYRFYLKS